MKKNNNIYFEETQKFYQKYLIFIANILPIVVIILIVVFDADLIQTLVLSLNFLLILIFFIYIHLFTYIDESGVSFKWRFFHKSYIKYFWYDIEKVEVITYRFVGYGYRISLKYGTVHNVKGNKGLQIWLRDGRKILIGTQKPEELKDFLKKIKKI